MASWLGTAAVLAHILIGVLHDIAHTELGVDLSVWQKTYVAIVIVTAPLVAGVLLWTRHARLGLLLLIISMAGSLIFAVAYHYVVISADHVSHLPPGEAQGLFRLTALMLLVAELSGLGVGLWGLRGFWGKT